MSFSGVKGSLMNLEHFSVRSSKRVAQCRMRLKPTTSRPFVSCDSIMERWLIGPTIVPTHFTQPVRHVIERQFKFVAKPFHKVMVHN
jgi:hypothetical protein